MIETKTIKKKESTPKDGSGLESGGQNRDSKVPGPKYCDLCRLFI